MLVRAICEDLRTTQDAQELHRAIFTRLRFSKAIELGLIELALSHIKKEARK